MYGIASKLARNNKRRSRNRVLRDLYGDEWTTEGFGVGDLGEGPQRRDNCIANAIESAHSKLAKNQPRPWVVTVGGNWTLSRKAKASTKWLDGEMDRLDAHELGERALLEAMVTGTGCLHVCERAGLPHIEQVYNEDLHVDPREEQNDCVRTLYRTMAVDREVLAERYPERRAEIEMADAWDSPDKSNTGDEIDETADLVLVTVAWHLPARAHKSTEADDDEEEGEEKPARKRESWEGRYVACVSTATLEDTDWTDDSFPFVFIRWRRRPRRFWGVGLAQAMAGAQAELDGIGKHIAESFHLATNSVWVEQGAKVNVDQVDNAPFRIYRYTGVPPQLFSPTAVNDQHLHREETLIRRAYEMQGISQLSAQAQKPAGIDSGKGLRTLNDIESERFLTQSRNYERLYVDMGKLLIAVAERIVEADGESPLEVVVGREHLEAISYRDARMGDHPHQIRVFPASALSSSPQGKLRDIEDLIALQAIDPEEARELLDFPDLEQSNTVRSAKRELAKKIVEGALDGKDVADLVTPYCDLDYLTKWASLQYNLAEIENAPNEALASLREVMGLADSLLTQAAEAKAAAMAAQQPAAAAAPPAPAGAQGLAAVPQ